MSGDVFAFFTFIFLSIFMAKEVSPRNASDPLHDWSILCKYQPIGYDCKRDGAMSNRFYYDLKMEDCKGAAFGNCEENRNMFGALRDCQDTCRDAGQKKINVNMSQNVYCRLQPDFGQCNDYYPMFYFDMTYRICRGFSYSGCGGNKNRFESYQLCSATCVTAIMF